MAGHTVPLCTLSLEEHYAKLRADVDKEALKFAAAIGRRVIKVLRARQEPPAKDAFLATHVAGLLRLEGVRSDLIDTVVGLVVERY